MSIRSHSGSDRPARNGPAIDANRATRCTEGLRDIAEDVIVVADAFINRTSDTAAPATELLSFVNNLDTLMQEAVAALVVRQRSEGKPLGPLAAKLNLSEDRLRKKYDPQTIDVALRVRNVGSCPFRS
ncbi:hypothetical protein [Streptomyces sp. ITFR-6]|uniref:hypothetical protein n=1 Tax=Streptomyces sp. ITFR-6 TaxID=3075197 RepID=UPI002889DEE7|nr:hypothetical protein [Streptomyces sp. ITFR-6]WNI34372.1 hypothetical protein RLT59_37775 [Streptomyces sp. ITFR-6]